MGERINPDYFRAELDRKMAYIADAGLVHAFGQGFHTNIDDRVTLHVRLAKYLVARCGAYPIVWLTAGEAAGSDRALREALIEGWRQVSLTIDRYDDYAQPQTAHYTSGWPT